MFRNNHNEKESLFTQTIVFSPCTKSQLENDTLTFPPNSQKRPSKPSVNNSHGTRAHSLRLKLCW
ncbi:hypothetical protein Hanom_Chr01g00080311 [Helianthus anomalus]